MAARVNFDEETKEAIKELYRCGYSTHDLAALYGAKHHTIRLVCKMFIRSKEEGHVLTSLRRGRMTSRACRYRARCLVEKLLKRKLKRTEVVHHKDQDWTNNNMANLEVLDLGEHSRLHNLERWHRQKQNVV